MSPHRKLDRPADINKTHEPELGKGVKKQRLTNSSREFNKNEEQTSPTGRGSARTQWNQMSQDRDRSTGRTTAPTERPELANSEWNTGQGERNQTTGSNVPGSEITDRKSSNAGQMNQTSRDKYPISSKSSPASEIKSPEMQGEDKINRAERKTYTGNSERTGQQYSVTGNSSQVVDENLKSGHPAHDQHRMHQQDTKKRSQSANKGMKQQRSDSVQRDQQRNTKDLNEE